MKKLIWLGAVSVALFAVTTVARAATDDVGFENIFQNVSIDLKVNGQDGPVTVERGSRIVVSWVSDSATRCRGNWSKNDIKTSGTVSGKISRSVVIKAACIDADGNRDDDSVVVNVSGGAVINQPTPIPPAPIPLPPAPKLPTSTSIYHSADYNHDWKIDNGELNRVLAYQRAGGYHVDPVGYDGFAPNDSTTPPSAQPTITGTITVTSPKDGEVFSQENAPRFTGFPAIPINWTSTGIAANEEVSVDIQKKGEDSKEIKTRIRIDSNTLYIPLSQYAPGTYQIRVTLWSNPKIVAYSGVFTITAPTTTTTPAPTASPITVDLKVNKGDGPTDGPVTVVAGTSIGLSYTTTGKVEQCNGDVTGTDTGSIRTTVNASRSFTVTCKQDGGSGTASDSVTVNVAQPTTTTGDTPTITVTGPLNSYSTPTSAAVTFTSSGVSSVKIEACVNKTDCTVLASSVPVTSPSSTWYWSIKGDEPFVGASGTKQVYLKVTDIASGVFDFTDSYIYIITPGTGATADSNLAGAGVPSGSVWEFLRAFFGGR